LKKDPRDCFSDFSNCGRPEILSQESKEVIGQSFCHQRGSCRELAKEILARRRKKRSKDTIHRFIRKSGYRPFHVVSKPLKTNLNRDNRLFLAEFVKDYDEVDFLNFAFSDEFLFTRLGSQIIRTIKFGRKFVVNFVVNFVIF